MGIEADIQKLEPGALIELFELDASGIGGPVQRFHGYENAGEIIWQGETYEPWPIQGEGFARSADGQQPQPVLTVGNIGMDVNGNPVPGIMSAVCLAYDDLVGAKLYRRQTLAKYLDAANFEGGNPDADPNEEFPVEQWIVEQKRSETSEAIEFVLANPIDFGERMLPDMQIVANICPWLWKGGYRGPYCGYTGDAMFDADGEAVVDPAEDRCGGRLHDCKLRFADQQGVSLDSAVVNFGGFPSADRLR